LRQQSLYVISFFTLPPTARSEMILLFFETGDDSARSLAWRNINAPLSQTDPQAQCL
jgi:hypothetical protein